MGVNPRITTPSGQAPATVKPPAGITTPPTSGIVLLDGAGNILKTVDNGDGTATLSTAPAATTIAVGLTGADQQISATPIDYRGLSVRETSGTTPAVLRVHNATTATGVIMDPVSLAPGESRDIDRTGGGGIKATIGIYVDIVSGAIEGSIYTG
jgi:hypothetical protein